ncbi:hypothetical protein AQUCO_01300001v1 [Aquilegia coerulea]|uniref:Uncharacterized protein n=1 Tax=Aquilegia coerulea TaxID=218851 RepID=A0A2G5DYZ2_AQUCA|nr:hypothetical protein AQUCO_01300001v1 [Aquilegia coerulea]
MDTFSSNQDLITKARKPYTITKQRERWTVEEHHRFLEAIKLYGRAWQRIEEHIGTKTAVQIRSHAQKFFSKLEREALIEGVPLGKGRDIHIPPPRPKRKPNTPYPRKTGAGTPNSIPVGVKDVNLLNSSSSSYSTKQIQDLDNDLHFEVYNFHKPCKRTRAKEYFDDANSSAFLTLSQETPCDSLSPSSKSPQASVVLANQCVFRNFIPSVKETSGADMDYGVSEDPKVTKCFHNLNEDVIKGANVKQPENLCLLTKEETRSNQNYPRHIPVHVLESNSETCTQCSEHDMTCPSSIIHQAERPFSKVNNFANPTASATTECHSSISIQQSLSSFPSLLNPFSNRDSYSMFVNPTFSNLIVSTLLQNPAAHAAASFAASFWPFSNMETPVDSPLCSFEGFQSRHGDLSPSTSAIAVATVMAASAWWAANGILPMRPLPLHTGLNFAPIIPSQTDTIEKEKSDHRILFSPCEGQQLDPGLSKALESKVPDTKLPPLSLSDCNKSGNTRSSNAEVEAASHKQKSLSLAALQEADKGKSKEQVDRSSCGSNTPSSSEVEMDLLEKHTNGKDEFNDQIINNWTSEPNNHRNRSAGNMNEFWREVSEEVCD